MTTNPHQAALAALLHTMEAPRSRAATEAWDAARAIVDAPPSVSAEDLMETAMCLWEQVLERRAESDPTNTLEHLGYGQTRLAVMALAEPCHLDWMAADFDDSFDWEYVPAWLYLNVTFDSEGVHLRRDRVQPEQPRA